MLIKFSRNILIIKLISISITLLDLNEINELKFSINL